MQSDLILAEINPASLNLQATLTSGQSFRWRRLADSEWLGVIQDQAVRLRSDDSGFWWQTYPECGRWDLIYEYFALDVPLQSLYESWIESEPRIAGLVARYAGMRILRQDAEEAFFSFLCASCNTVHKITRTIRSLERRYGEPIVELNGESVHRFPPAETIAEASEHDLRSDLWGFRAPRLIAAARHIASRGPGWLEALRKLPYREAHRELAGFYGIGAKIADCVCLFGLWHDEAVPIDVHVRRMAIQMFEPTLQHRSLTETAYWTLGDLVRERFGPYAGWAQQYLFYEDLRKPSKDLT